MRTPRQGAYALLASAVGLSGLALTTGTATAAHEAPAPCLEVTADTTLSGDVGPCNGHGIVVTANNVTLDLGGFTVTGSQQVMEQAGVLLDGVTGVTVKNGTVTGFDAGVSIEGGSGNTVTGLTVRDNVNDMIEPLDPRSILINRETGPTLEQRQQIAAVTCDYGDGITTFDSNDNLIEGNVVTGNGPYGGITLVDDSNRNVVRNNEVRDNDLLNREVTDAAGNPVFVDSRQFLDDARTIRNPKAGHHVGADSPGAIRPTSMCGATEIGTPGMGRGREVQSINIRIEGPGADENVVDSNNVTKGGLAGISFHSYVLVPAADNVPVGESNTNNIVSNNSVSRTGEDTNEQDTFADGIASLASGPVGTVTRPSDSNTIVRNDSFDNFRHGISLGRLTFGNTVDKNRVNNNGGSGIWVAGPTATPPNAPPSFDPQGAHDNSITRNHGRGNAEFDGTDLNPDCDNNVWKANNLRTFNQPCVATGGSGKAPGRGGTGAGNSADAPGGINRPAR